MTSPLPARAPVWDTVTAPHRLSLGLRALAPDESWLELDADLECDLKTKYDLLRHQRDQVFVELPESRDAQREVRSIVMETLLARYPELYSSSGSHFKVHASDETIDLDDPARPPLEAAARCVQEDLVVMQAGPRGWCLTAGAVCFPTRWDLPANLGQPLTHLHAPVPGYREELDSSSTQFFDRMKHGTVFRRGNWSLLDDPALFQPGGRQRHEANSEITAANAGQKVWLRAEHQTLQRLPMTGAILFAIRVHRKRLDALALEPEIARSLMRAVETMRPAMQRYKSLAVVRDAAVGYLRQVAERA